MEIDAALLFNLRVAIHTWSPQLGSERELFRKSRFLRLNNGSGKGSPADTALNISRYIPSLSHEGANTKG